ncbi:MAG: hypothetical protein WCE75_09290 [Terracidiphilus sp.]
MKRILGLALFMMLSSVAVFAAKNSQDITLSSDVRVGATQLHQGHYQATWTEVNGSQVQLTLRSKDNNSAPSATVPARLVNEAGNQTAVVTATANGVDTLVEVRTPKARFILENPTVAAK